MDVETAKAYFRRSDDEESTIEDIVDLFADGAVLKSPREGVFHGRDGVREFFQRNAEFFAEGAHDIQAYYECDGTVVCEGTINGRTTAGREYEGIGLVDVMELNDDDEITALRVYLDYSGILDELPESVPNFRE